MTTWIAAVTTITGIPTASCDRSIVRRWTGLRAVSISVGVLAAAALAQAIAYVVSGSVALLADLVQNAGDALTALPLGVGLRLPQRPGRARQVLHRASFPRQPST